MEPLIAAWRAAQNHDDVRSKLVQQIELQRTIEPAVLAKVATFVMRVAQVQSDWTDILQLSTRALNMEEDGHPDETLAIAAALDSLGQTYIQMYKHKEAKGCLERALHIKERILEDGHLDTVHTLDSLGNLCKKIALTTLKYTCSVCAPFERKLSVNLISRLQNHGLIWGGYAI